jgi:hypothetical protein
LVFLSPLFSTSFSLLFCTCFFSHVVSFLAYLNLLGNERLVVVVVSMFQGRYIFQILI